MTPREIAWTIEGSTWRQQQAIKRAKMAAWMVSAWRRAAKLPKLSTVLGEKDTHGGRQSVAQQTEIVKLLHAKLGGVLTIGETVEGRA